MNSESLAGQAGLPNNWREAKWLLLILALAFLLRITYLPSHSVIEGDGVHYATLGESIARGEGLPNHKFPPGYPLTIAILLYLGTSESEVAGRAVSFVMGMIGVGLLAVVGRQLYGPVVGLAAGFLGAIYPPFIRKSVYVMSEATYMAAWLGAVAALLAGLRKRHPGYLIGAGFLAGFSYLTRPEGAALVLVGLVVMCLEGWRLALSRLRLSAGILLFTVGASLFIVPYASYLKTDTGSWSLSGKTLYTLRWGEAPAGDPEALEMLLFTVNSNSELQESTFTQSSTEAYLLDNLGHIGKRYVRNLYAEYWLLSKSLFSFLLIALIGVGLMTPPWNESRLRREAFCLALLLPLLIIPVFVVTDHYLIPSAPIFLLWGGRGLVQVDRWAIEATPSAWLWGVRVALLIGITATTAFPLLARPLLEPSEEPTEWRAAGMWISDHLPSDALLLSRRAEIGYYAKRRFLPIPYGSLDDVSRYAKKHGATVLAFDERFTAPLRPQLQLLVSGFVPAGLELQHIEGSRRGQRVFIYEFK